MKILRGIFYGSCSVMLLVSCVLMGHLHADAATLIISEVKVRNDTNGFDEYIELYNSGTTALSLNNYFIGYVNTPTPLTDQEVGRSVIAQGLLEPGKYFLLAKNDTDSHLLLAQKSPFTSLSDSGGTLQITDDTGTIVDQVHWTASSSVATPGIMYLPGTTVSKAQSLARNKTPQGDYIITPASWQLSTPSPESSALLPLPPNLSDIDQADPSPAPVDVTDTTGDTDDSQTSLAQTIVQSGSLAGDIAITEMLPNPAAPATDEVDEYIELHNQSSEPVNLKDYKLQSGNNFTYSYVFPDHILQPDAYEAFKVSETHLLLSNSSGRSRLLGPSGEVISQTDAYGAASAGKAWALVEDHWQWTDTATPGTANVASTTIATKTTATKVTATKVTATKTTKVAAAKTTAKAPKTSTTKAKAASTAKKTSTAASNKSSASPTGGPPRLHPFILAGVGVSTVLYGLYEYRQDIVNTMRRLRSNRSLRREIGGSAQGAGSD